MTHPVQSSAKSSREGHPRCRRQDPLRSFVFLLACTIGMAAAHRAVGAVFEWEITDQTIVEEVSTTLERYYRIIRTDSAAVRYITSSAGSLPVVVRARDVDSREEPEIVMVRYGQLQLFESDDIRIALGEGLYDRLRQSRRDGTSTRGVVLLGDPHGHADWQTDNRVVFTLLERIDVRIAERLNLFAQIGAPESSRDFWADGTARLGLAGTAGEAALLLPFSGGSVAFGPIPERRLSPGIGAYARLRSHPFDLSARFSLPYAGTLTSTRTIDGAYVPRLSIAAGADLARFSGSYGDLSIKAGLTLDEFARVIDRDLSDVVTAGAIRRLAPLVEVTSESPDNTLLLTVGTRNFALRAVSSLRISRSIWLDLRVTRFGLLTDLEPFDSELSLFFSPRIKF